ncbi:MAG: FAD:protein FMN transferase [Akkermansiaceae bacterium]
MKSRLPWLAAGILLAFVGILTWWNFGKNKSPYITFEGKAFATNYSVTYLRGPELKIAKEAVEAELERIDSIASSWNQESELMRYGRSPDLQAFHLSSDLAFLLKRSNEIEQQTAGAFSIHHHSKHLDLSAIAKGYAVDQIVGILRSHFNIQDCLVEIGGEIKASGNGPSGSNWQVGIYSPSSPTPQFELQNTSIATSGNDLKGEHIIDPRDLQKKQNHLFSASVIHPSNTTADALATALFVMGPEAGLKWAREHHIHTIFILKDGTQLEHIPNK